MRSGGEKENEIVSETKSASVSETEIVIEKESVSERASELEIVSAIAILWPESRLVT